MRVLMTNDLFQYSGAEVIFISLGEQLRRMGHEVKQMDHRTTPAIGRIAKEFGPDVIHQHNCTAIGPITWSLKGSHPIVQTVHDYWPVCRSRERFRLGEGICPRFDTGDNPVCSECINYMYRLPHPPYVRAMMGGLVLVGVSACVANRLSEYGYKDVHVVYNGIVPEADLFKDEDGGFIFCSAKAKQHTEINNYIKGAWLFNELAKRLPEYRFVHAGGGDWDSVEELGMLDRLALMDHYRKASLVVLPSLWEEPNGLPCQEAMQYGKVVLAFDRGGIPEYVKNFIVKTSRPDQVGGDDIDNMAGMIRKLMEDPETRKEKGGENRKRMLEKFTLEQMAKGYVDIYHWAIAKKRREAA